MMSLIVKTRYIMKISSNLDINIFGDSSLSNLDHENSSKLFIIIKMIIFLEV